jgi:Mrp family chromosome partitioning ATPase
MSKVYEALENAKESRKKAREERGQDGFRSPDSSGLPFPGFKPYSHPPLYPSPDMEGEMTRLYQNIEIALAALKTKTLQFIGSKEGEGTSTIIREFAKVAALRFNRSVVLVDADRYHPVQSTSFNFKPRSGWADALLDGNFDVALQQIGTTNLFISPISNNAYVPPSVFCAPGWGGFLAKLKERFDLSLFDSPPATVCADCLALSGKMDGVILVVAAEETRWPVIEMVRDNIRRNGGTILGMVFNKRKYYIPKFIYERL